jgi:hypothetical protein
MVRYTLKYATTRAELWHWYWRAWARPVGYWLQHVLIGAAVAIGFAWASGFPTSSWWSTARIGVAITLACVVLFPLWPQIRFKPQVRTLELDVFGYKTSIGRLRGDRRWTEIQSVQDDGDTVVLTTRRGNAMLIPRRAFGDGVDRQQFVADVRAWHGRTTI